MGDLTSSAPRTSDSEESTELLNLFNGAPGWGGGGGGGGGGGMMDDLAKILYLFFELPSLAVLARAGMSTFRRCPTNINIPLPTTTSPALPLRYPELWFWKEAAVSRDIAEPREFQSLPLRSEKKKKFHFFPNPACTDVASAAWLSIYRQCVNHTVQTETTHVS